jgi:hypothetical protein
MFCEYKYEKSGKSKIKKESGFPSFQEGKTARSAIDTLT